MATTTLIAPFRNEPLTNFSDPQNKRAMEEAIATVKSQLGKTYPLRIGGEKVMTEDTLASINPGNLDEVVGYVSMAKRTHVDQAMEAALKTFETWKRVPARERAEYLFRAAELLRQRKHEFSAWMILEAGKNWSEADADTAEAIDFLEYYGREMIRLSEVNIHQPLVKISDEDNQLTYIPLGVGVVIAPWNFPLAILIGMTTAAVVAGNTVLLKPSLLTPIVANHFVSLMEEAGLPEGVINFIPGQVEDVGDYLTSHPRTRFISFTGSKQVGLHINRIAAQTAEGQIWIKRVVAEMGGKDGIVVDETANLEAAAEAIVASAFGFQGQKCSAGSRAIVVESVYEKVLDMVVEKTKHLKIGLPELNYPIGPVSDQKAFDKIMKYIEIGKQEGRLLVGGEKAEGNGYYIQPTIFADVHPKARIMQEEIFGPVLAFTKAADYKEAIAIYNDTEYGLTGSFFSNDEQRIQYAMEEMHCGNLYINRKCTGALVGVHPFGGFNMSGTDSKAGGPDYLLLFTQGKVISRQR
jgi:1-pyrroline-5-carboxylate dehydrogenase